MGLGLVQRNFGWIAEWAIRSGQGFVVVSKDGPVATFQPIQRGRDHTPHVLRREQFQKLVRRHNPDAFKLA